MGTQEQVNLYENQSVRSVWDDEKEEWYFSIEDVVSVLTESKDPKQYIKKMRTRDKELSVKWGTICTTVRMKAADGKMRKIQAAPLTGIFRIIQSIPSPKAESFKMWLAEVGKELTDAWDSHGIQKGLEYACRGGDKGYYQRYKSPRFKRK